MDDTKPHAHRVRAGRLTQPAPVYWVTLVTAHRQIIFDDFSAARVLIQILKAQSDGGRASTRAFVLMPDHLHWFMQACTPASLAQCVRCVKSVSAQRLGWQVWQRGFQVHTLPPDDERQTFARRVMAAPVQAGLSYALGHYPHWDANWL